MPRSTRKPKPAFPLAISTETVAQALDFTPGLTDRDLFAAFSLAGIRASGVEFDARMAARTAFIDADAMCDEAAKGGAR